MATDHHMLQSWYVHTVLPTSWPSSQKNRLQVPGKHLERVPRPESRSTQNVNAMDTHKYKVFT